MLGILNMDAPFRSLEVLPRKKSYLYGLIRVISDTKKGYIANERLAKKWMAKAIEYWGLDSTHRFHKNNYDCREGSYNSLGEWLFNIQHIIESLD